jgi:hypothetical protein
MQRSPGCDQIHIMATAVIPGTQRTSPVVLPVEVQLRSQAGCAWARWEPIQGVPFASLPPCAESWD